MPVIRNHLGITYKLVSSSEPRLGMVLSAIKKLDDAKPKRARIKRELTELETFETNLQRQIREFKQR